MSVEISELSDSARQVVDGLGLAADEAQAWSQVAELGWLMLEIPEDDGGLGLGLPAACALHTELGRGLAKVPYIAATLAIDALCQSTIPGREQWLEQLGCGEAYITVPLATCDVTLMSDRLTGTAAAIPSADCAKHVIAWTDAGKLLLIPTDAPGVELTARSTWDRTRRLYDLRLDGVDINACTELGSDADAVSRLLLRRDFALAAEAVGGAAAILERTVAYLGERQQFGRPLAMFQALKHRCADLKAQVEAAAALLRDGLAKSTGAAGDFNYTPSAEAAGQAAKLLAASVYTAVVEESLQLHGGIGMTEEHDCHLFLKRAMLDEHLGRGRDAYAEQLVASRLFAAG